MLLVTIQDKKVLDLLKNGKFYEADFNYIFNDIEHDESGKMAAYQFVMKHYGYVMPPIFCGVPLRYTNFNNTKLTKNSVLLEVSIPDKLVHLISIWSWETLLCSCIDKTMTTDEEDYFKHALCGGDIDDIKAIQAIIPCIKPTWLIGAYAVPDNFIEYFKSKQILFSSNYNNSEPIYSSF